MFTPHTPQEVEEMLKVIGAETIEELFDKVPENFRFPELNIPEGLSEMEIASELKEIASANATTDENQIPVQTNPNPANNTGNIPITQTNVQITIEDPEGDTFNWTIEGQYITNASENDDANGTKTANLQTPLPYNTNVIWYVNTTDDYGGSNAVYNFTV